MHDNASCALAPSAKFASLQSMQSARARVRWGERAAEGQEPPVGPWIQTSRAPGRSRDVTPSHHRRSTCTSSSQARSPPSSCSCSRCLQLWEDLWVEPEELTREDLEGFASKVLAGAGWSIGSPPTFRFDVADESASAGWHEGATGVIHLHPRLLTYRTVLHELAHWVDPRDGHGSRFCANHVELMRAAFGDAAANDMLSTYREWCVSVDMEWLRTWSGCDESS